MDYGTWLWKVFFTLVGALWLGISIASPEIPWLGVLLSFIVLCLGIGIGRESLTWFKKTFVRFMIVLSLCLLVGFIIVMNPIIIFYVLLISPVIFLSVFIAIRVGGFLISLTPNK